MLVLGILLLIFAQLAWTYAIHEVVQSSPGSRVPLFAGMHPFTPGMMVLIAVTGAILAGSSLGLWAVPMLAIVLATPVVNVLLHNRRTSHGE